MPVFLAGCTKLGPVSVAVALEHIRDEMANFGPTTYLLTVTDDQRPHAVSVAVVADEASDGLVVRVGSRTASNAAARPEVTLLWPPSAPGEFSLIVDGRAHVDDDRITITPTKAVKHRAAVSGPDAAYQSECQAVGDPEAEPVRH